MESSGREQKNLASYPRPHFILIMNYEYLDSLRKNHPAWRLLSADSAQFVISFLEMTFIHGNIRSIRESLLEEKLDDYLIHIRSVYGEDSFPRRSSEYLDDWSESSHGWVRKYYPRKGDEAEYDITPAAEKAIEWIRTFEKKEFVGTESRLILIFSMLRDLVNSTERDPEKRIAELEKRKTEIDNEIERIKNGQSVSFDSRQIRENLWRIEEEIRNLMSDFREVEDNFRSLDRQTREKIATSSLGKSEILDEIFSEQDTIEHSEQGKSFSAFWLFLMSRNRQDELDRNAKKILGLDCVKETGGSPTLHSMKYNLLDAGDRAKKTLGNLNEQLRTFLDEKLWLDNKRIMDLIKSVEEKALRIRNNPPKGKDFLEIDSLTPEIALPMERILFTPPEKPPLLDENLTNGIAVNVPDALYSQHYVDEARLRENIKIILADKSQVSLKEIGETYPFRKGLSEIITYMVIASRDENSLIDDTDTQEIEYIDNDVIKIISLPRVIFTR